MGSSYTPPVNLASPGPIGGTTPAAVAGTTFRAGDGTVGAPSFSFTSATNTGFYQGGAHQIYTAHNGSVGWIISAGSLYAVGAGVLLPNAGTAGSPSLQNINTGTDGVYFPGGNVVGISTNAVLRFSVSTTLVISTLPISLPSFTVGTVPSASPAGQLIYVSDAAVAPCVAFSNGTVWKRCDNAGTTVV